MTRVAAILRFILREPATLVALISLSLLADRCNCRTYSMTNNQRRKWENCGERGEARENAYRSEEDSGSTSRLNSVNHPTSCLRINCLRFIRSTVRCRLHKRPSVKTIIRGRLPLQLFCTSEVNYVPDKTNIRRFIELLIKRKKQNDVSFNSQVSSLRSIIWMKVN